MKFLTLGLSSLALLTSLLACNFRVAEGAEDKTGPEYSSDYICPMYCEGSGSEKPGICPACDMDYEPNKLK